MSIKLNGATNGSVELDVPDAIGSDVSLTIPGTTGTVLAAPGSTNITVPSSDGTLDRLERAGNILQVVQNYNTDRFSTSLTANSETHITQMNTSFTPTSSSSKVLVRVRWCGEWNTNTYWNMVFRLIRDNTNIGLPPASGTRRRGLATLSIGYHEFDAASTPDNFWYEYLDSPNTTSTVEYKIGVVPTLSGTLYTNRSASNPDNTAAEILSSSITLIEVAG